MIDVNISHHIFNNIYVSHLDNDSRTQIYYGGSSSGKSVFLAQRDVLDILKGGRNFLICRAVASTIKNSVFNEIVKVINDWGLRPEFNINKTDKVIACRNGYQFLFAGLDDVNKIKSITPQQGVITDVRIEEATEVTYEDVKQLIKRQRGGSGEIKKRLVLSFNPIYKLHWIYKTYFGQVGWTDEQAVYKADDLSILKTWYIHNRFLTPGDVEDLEDESDDYFYQVYSLGNWGVLGDVIFTNWEVQDLSDMHDQFTNRLIGLDFGFSSDPAAVIKMHYDTKRKALYIYDEIYERGLTNDMLASEIREHDIGRNDYIICDSAEPKSITDLRNDDLLAIGAKKGKDSVNHGIDWLKRQRIIIDKRCVNTITEFTTYQWMKDKDGNSLKKPVDKNNHAIDAIRYGTESEAIYIPALM